MQLSTFLWTRVDINLIDSKGPIGVSNNIWKAAAYCRKIQNGKVFSYAIVMFACIVVFVSLIFFNWDQVLNSFPILSSIVILPIFGALISMLIKGSDKDVSKNVIDCHKKYPFSINIEYDIVDAKTMDSKDKFDLIIFKYSHCP